MKLAILSHVDNLLEQFPYVNVSKYLWFSFKHWINMITIGSGNQVGRLNEDKVLEGKSPPHTHTSLRQPRKPHLVK